MISLSPSPNFTNERHPCSECGITMNFKCVKMIKTMEELTFFMENVINWEICPSCGWRVEAPVPIRVRFEGLPRLSHDFVPFHTLQNPKVVERLAQETPHRVNVVFTLDELKIAIQARTMIESQRLGKSAVEK